MRKAIHWFVVILMAVSLAAAGATRKVPEKVQPSLQSGSSQAVLGQILEPTPVPAPWVVLWDQPLSGSNTGAYGSQEFEPASAAFTMYLADDFENYSPWVIHEIYIPGGGWNGFATLMNAASLNWAIYADAAGLPSGYPGSGATPEWSLSLPPGDPQVAITTGTGGLPSNVTLTLATPVSLPAGNWWLIFYPQMDLTTGGQYGRQAADTNHVYTAQWINPGGGFGNGTSWNAFDIQFGITQQDLAFRLGGVSGCDALYDNGPLVNSAGTGAGGADESTLQTSLGMIIYGFGNQVSAGNRLADDFTITDPGGWDVETLTFYGYQTNSTLSSTFFAVNYRIWDGPPNNPGSTVVFGDTTTNRFRSTYWSGIYRVLDTASGNTQRPVMEITVHSGVHLAPGTYWVDWQVDGTLGSGPYAPPITINGQTTTGNALHYTSTGWANAVDTGTGTQQGLPFVVQGCVGIPFDMNFYDDVAAAVQCCVVRETGQYAWTVLSGPTTYTNRAEVINGGSAIWNGPADPNFLYVVYDPVNLRAYGYFYDTGCGIFTSFWDNDTTDSPIPCP